MIDLIRELIEKICKQGFRPNRVTMNVATYQRLKAIAGACTYFTDAERRPATVFGIDINIDDKYMDGVISVRDLLHDAQAIGSIPMAKCKDITIRQDRAFGFEVDDIEPWGWTVRGGKVPNESLPARYIVNDDACILFWDSKGKTKTVVKRCKDDNIDPIKAFLWAYFEKTSGMSKTKANKYLQKVEADYQNYKEN